MNNVGSYHVDGVPDLSEDLENWMSRLPHELKQTPIIYLAIPGSHDSFTSKITSDSELAPDAEDSIKKLSFLGSLLKVFLVKWSRTQTYMAHDQLIRGIRYFDLRIGTRSGNQDLFIVHALYSAAVQSCLDEISAFLDTHTQEVVILDFQHFYGFTQNEHDRLMQMINKTFGTKLLPYNQHMNYVTLEYMTIQYRYQVICIYRSDAARFGQPLLWPSRSFPNPWPNTVSKTYLYEYLHNGLKNRPAKLGYITQCILTPPGWYIFKNLYSSLKKKCAIKLEESRSNWIENQSPGEGGMNIIIADFIELSDCKYVKEVVNVNQKLILNNKRY
ncbi:PI-PLC X domain-containing protein 3-like [Diorhabda sublineata]|uniref:PI-PLC X domain-containing protein 3-like n=1 Tax=Diorhabda sublineata TaxID=1163346 RepID=UPI0024E06DCE|nr:PI-PLC X domain-containing protein 3-like [Diorhabda sublineata]XP_056646503.1 PI-PLC X domain-containing protein 3-like [Diorhabda sublineata]